MPRLRFSVTSLLLTITFVVLCLTVWTSYRDWYVSNYEDEVLSSLLRNIIRNGDSVAQVTDRLGVEGVDVEAERASFSAGLHDVVQKIASSRLSGVLATDEFLNFDFGKSGIVLQFRDGRLVNHDPAEFGIGTPYTFRKMRRTPLFEKLHQLGWQMGHLQGVAALVAVVAVITAIKLAKSRGYSRIAVKTMIVAPILLCITIVCLAAGVRPHFLTWLIVAFTGFLLWYGLEREPIGSHRLHRR